jgi:hypothetical protein
VTQALDQVLGGIARRRQRLDALVDQRPQCASLLDLLQVPI